MREFNIITSLWGPKEESIQLVRNSRLLEKFFKDKECIYVWAYESIPTIIGCGVDKVNNDVIPRMLRWVCQQSPKSQTISRVFDSPMLIIKAIIEMTPEEEQLKIASGELFENLRSSTIVQSKNGGSKRGREVVNDEGDFKKSKKQKSKSKMKKAIRNLQDRVAVVEGQLTSDEGDRKGFEGLVDHTLESEEMDNAKIEDVDTGGTPNWLRMPKEDNTSDEDVHNVGTPSWLRFNIELEKPIDVLEKKVEIGLEEPIDVVDDEIDFELELQTSVQMMRCVKPFMGKIEDIFRDLFMCRRWLADEHLDALFLFIRFKIKAAGIPSAQNFTTADTIFVVWNRHDTLYSTGLFARRGGSSTYKKPWPVVIVDSIPLQRNNSDCGVFTIKYFEYIAVVRQPWLASVTRHSINLEQKILQSSERPFCNVFFDLRTDQGLYLNRSEWRFTPIAIASEAMHRVDI
ncbi:Ulp1-like peptidase [Cucumis melo var. makuwa]|uniref:Ulp1-like peptidase n=1 Tax=Cucumis melo var. makuwa TaxID=1194695 RepID=A0A5D3DHE6_CUCMM|nr:Ulp1-like peptidase [Cucumis melo var. makuwa]